jgi:hypothetical protein
MTILINEQELSAYLNIQFSLSTFNCLFIKKDYQVELSYHCPTKHLDVSDAVSMPMSMPHVNAHVNAHVNDNKFLQILF